MMVLYKNLHLPSSDLNGTLCVTNFTQGWDIVLLIVECKQMMISRDQLRWMMVGRLPTHESHWTVILNDMVS